MKSLRLLLSVIVLFSLSCKKDKPAVAPQEGLISYFNFNDNLKDQQAYANDGVAKNNPVYVFGKIGKALKLNGINQSVEFNAIPQDAPNGVSVAFWLTAASIDDFYVRYVLSLADKNSNVLFVGTATNNTIGSRITNQAPNTSASYIPGSWFHAAVTFDGNIHKLYIDGVLVSSLNDNASLSAYFSKLTLGYNPFDDKYLLAIIDELYIYNRALTQAEVTQLYNLK